MKKYAFLLAFIALLPFLAVAQPPSDAYKLVHFNDFTRDSADMGDDISKDFPLDNGNVSGTYSYPIKKNVYQKNGFLHNAVLKEWTPHPTNPNAPTRRFSGADWHEYASFRYGYFESRFKITKLDHIWGCFWLLKNNGLGPYQEIDILECFTAAKKGSGYISASEHWWESQNSSKTKHWNTDFGAINLDSFHTYGCEWTPTTLRFYIDGELKSTMPNYQMHDPMQIKFDVKRQKSKKRWRKIYSYGVDTTPSVLMADYIRVWQIPNAGSVYGTGQKNLKDSVICLKSIAKAQQKIVHWENMLHVAFYPQARYAISCPSKNMIFNEVLWPLASGEGYNFRGEVTKGFYYACDVAGTYPVKIKVSFPDLSDFEEEVTFMVTIE